MAINSAFFNQLKSAFVPLLKRVIALIPTKTSDLTNDSDFLTEADVTQASRRSTLSLGKTPTFLISEETTTSGGGSVTAGAGTNAGTTTYALKRYTAEAVRAIIGSGGSGSGTDLTNLEEAEAIDDADAFPIIQPGEQPGEVDVRKVSLTALRARLGHCTVYGSFTETGGACTVENVDPFDLDALLAAELDDVHAVFYDGDGDGHVFRAADVVGTALVLRFVCDEGTGVSYVLTCQVYADEQDVPEDDYYLENAYQGATVYVAFRILRVDDRALRAVVTTDNYLQLNGADPVDLDASVAAAQAGMLDRVHASIVFGSSGNFIYHLPCVYADMQSGEMVFLIDTGSGFLSLRSTMSTSEPTPSGNEYVLTATLGGNQVYVLYHLEIQSASSSSSREIITGNLDLSNFNVSNLSHTFAEVQAGIALGKRPELHLSYTNPVQQTTDTVIADLRIFGSGWLDFSVPLRANLDGTYRVFLFSAEWTESNGLQITPSIIQTA